MAVSNRELEYRIEMLTGKMALEIKNQPLEPNERNKKVWSLQEPDRLVKGLSFFDPSSIGIKEVSTHEYYTDPIRMYYCQAVGVVELGNEVPLMYSDGYTIEAEVLGGEVIFPEKAAPALKKPVIEKKRDLSKLIIPNPYNDGRMPYVIELNKIHNQNLGNFIFAPTSCIGPFSLAVILRGYQNIFFDMKNDPLFVHELLDFCCKVVVKFGKALQTVNKVSPTLQEAWSCLPNISPQIFYEFCLPYITRCIEALRHPETGKTGSLFYGWGSSLTKDWKEFLRTLCAMGISGIPISEEEIKGIGGYKKIDLGEFKEITYSRGITLMALIHPSTMLRETPEEIERLVKGWFAKAGKGGGFVISASLPVDAPEKNVKAYLKAIDESKYPVQEKGEE